MGEFNISSKQLEEIKNGAIILAQTDTTVGFLSTSTSAINEAKGRDNSQSCIKTFASLNAAKRYLRYPQISKNIARRAKCCTIAVRDKSARIVRNCEHQEFLKALENRSILGLFSSSANAHGKEFDVDFALQKAQLLQLRDKLSSSKADSRISFFSAQASRLLKFNSRRKFKLR